MKKGFTLIELLAVIVILAIILAIAIPGISNVINSSTKGAAESNAKMVLDTVRIKQLEDSNLDPTTINETNVESLLGISAENYERLTIKKMNGKIYVTIVGKGKWNNLTISGTSSSTRVDDTVVNFVRGANAPVLTTGMTPIKWNGSTWVDTTSDDTAWYNYDTTNKIWANARTADGSMWVWIPRYIYKISTGWHTNTTGTIDVQFTKGVDDNWNKSVIGNIDLGETANASNNKWTNHPAFTFGDKELTGIWVAKFEASAPIASSCYTSPSYGNCNVSNMLPLSIPNVNAWRYIKIGNMFTVARKMETDNIYGWGTTGTGIDTHIMKNIEWGAVTYLSKSTYGQNTNEVWINPANTFTTGCAGDSVSSATTTGCLRTYDTTNGVNASTTGNIYGIYDMSGGSYEYLAVYLNNGSSYLNIGSTAVNATSLYKDIYTVGTPDTIANNYGLTINKKGDALYEISNAGTGSTSWFSDTSNMMSANPAWFARGNRYSNGASSGIFAFESAYGYEDQNYGFRPVLLVGSGL